MISLNRTYKTADLFRIPAASAPGSALFLAAENLLTGLQPALLAVCTADFVDRAVKVAQKELPLRAVVWPLAGMFLLLSYNWIFMALAKFASVRMELQLRETFRLELAEKRAKLDYRHVEDAGTWDLISRVSKEPETTLSKAYADLWSLASLLLKAAGVTALLLSKVWWAAVVIVAVTIPLIRLTYQGGKAGYDSERQTARYRRRYEYLSEVLTGRDAVEERSIFGFSAEVGKTWFDNFETARKIEYKVKRNWYIRCKAGSVATTFVSLLVMLVLLQPTLSGKITIGMFISLTGAVSSLIQEMSWNLTNVVDRLAKSIEYLKDLTIFAALSETQGALKKPVKGSEFLSLSMKDVRFAYPGTAESVLNGLSLQLEPGRHYAFVGANGAGKTTVTKLLTGLYDGFSGEIQLNGKSFSAYSQGELKGFFSVVFQDFARYAVSLKDNILLGDAAGMESADLKALEKAAEQSGLLPVIQKLPQGVETPLGKIKADGADLSGGEWQRVAMARALLSPAPILILDEPTAALDPVAESRMYEEFEAISRGKTTLFISHRLGSTKLADEIFVLDGGRIAEQGSHDELMKAGGLYAEMFESQRKWYE